MTYTQKERKERVLKYFIKTPEKPNYKISVTLIVIAVIFILKGYAQYDLAGVLLVLIGLVGLYFLLKKTYRTMSQYKKDFKIAEPKATDKEMDDWMATGYQMILAEARRRLGIDEEDISGDPLMIDGPAHLSYVAPGKDRLLRFYQHNILLLYLTDHNIATYKCIFDLGIGEILTDSTKEFPYKDITNLETRTTTDTFHYNGSEKTGVKGVQTLNLYTSGSNNISANYMFSKDIMEDYIVPPSDAENTIRAVRKRLKEYKDKYSNSN